MYVCHCMVLIYLTQNSIDFQQCLSVLVAIHIMRRYIYRNVPLSVLIANTKLVQVHPHNTHCILTTIVAVFLLINFCWTQEAILQMKIQFIQVPACCRRINMQLASHVGKNFPTTQLDCSYILQGSLLKFRYVQLRCNNGLNKYGQDSIIEESWYS